MEFENERRTSRRRTSRRRTSRRRTSRRRNPFALIVVLFILLIIVGTAFIRY